MNRLYKKHNGIVFDNLRKHVFSFPLKNSRVYLNLVSNPHLLKILVYIVI